MEWRAQSFRLTLITQDPYINDNVDWWEKLLGSKPDQFTQQPNSFGSKFEGIFESNNLVLDVKPERIDWNLITREDTAGGPKKEVTTLGLMDEALKPFQELTEHWLTSDNLPNVKRIAFGAKLFIPVKDVITGYSILNKYIHNIDVNYEYPSDFLYQINKIRNSKSGIANLNINRLTKWSVTKFRTFLLSPDSSESLSHIDLFACTLDLDINTAKHTNEIPHNKLKDIFNELTQFGLEIADKGDIE